jgi:hypothetical protein
MSAVIGHGSNVDAAGHDHAHDEHHGAPHMLAPLVYATNHKDIGVYLICVHDVHGRRDARARIRPSSSTGPQFFTRSCSTS